MGFAIDSPRQGEQSTLEKCCPSMARRARKPSCHAAQDCGRRFDESRHHQEGSQVDLPCLYILRHLVFPAGSVVQADNPISSWNHSPARFYQVDVALFHWFPPASSTMVGFGSEFKQLPTSITLEVIEQTITSLLLLILDNGQ